jgi:enoyl-CoA hydratase
MRMNKVRTERDGPILTVIIDRPEVRNSVDDQTANDLIAAFSELESDDSLSVGVLWGNEGSFCAGADLKAVAAGERSINPDTEDFFDQAGPMGPSRMLLKKPVIAAISGHAVAGGLELALWCDMRVAEEDSVLGVYCRRWGVPLIDGGTVRLPRLIGLSHALDLILTGRGVTADEALRIGLVNRVVPPGESRQVAEELAHQLCKFPQGCLRADRMSAYGSFDREYEQAMINEFQEGVKILAAEAVPGAKRFAAGRGRHGDFSDI